MEQYLSVSEYAALHRKDAGNVRRMLAAGRLEGSKVGNQWIIPADAAYPVDKRETTGQYRNWRKRMALNADKALMSTLRQMIHDLQSIYGASLQAVILYGSYARGTQTEESDVDIAVVLSEKPDKALTNAMIDCVASYELECGRVLSVIDINAEMLKRWESTIPFYKNIRKEGITLWNAVA